MKIIADKDIPLVQHYFANAGDLVLISGRALRKEHLKDADMLLVRSITPVNADLLEGTNVKFVASPTTGMDHFDVDWLASVGITWANASGCNAIAVVEYIICVVAALQKQGYLFGDKLRAGVVGVGNIGSRVAEKLKLLGFDVLLCDPLRAENEKDFPHQPLETFSNLDLITLHTPLTQSGHYPTFHMINEAFLERQKKNTVLMNTGRGSVIDFNDLKLFGQYLLWCLDVWEHEPFIDFEVLDRAIIATPHIAGYTVQSKYRGIEMIYRAAVDKGFVPENIRPLDYPTYLLDAEGVQNWRDLILKIYDPMVTTRVMKKEIIENNVASFDRLRKEFIERHELDYVKGWDGRFLINYPVNPASTSKGR